MGQDWYSCNHCGEAVSDYHNSFTNCECGKTWCDEECADLDGFIRYDEDYDGEIPMHPDYGRELESSCKYCRGEDVDDSDLLAFVIEHYGFTRDSLIAEYNEKQKD